jgi:hypothetical protein
VVGDDSEPDDSAAGTKQTPPVSLELWVEQWRNSMHLPQGVKMSHPNCMVWSLIEAGLKRDKETDEARTNPAS